MVFAALMVASVLAGRLLNGGVPLALEDTQVPGSPDVIGVLLSAQGAGALIAIMFALILGLPMSWVGRGRLIGTVPAYLLFLVFWGPIAIKLYPWVLSLFDYRLLPQAHLAYFTSGVRDFYFFAAIGTTCLVGPIVEEIIFRGFLQTGLAKIWGKWVALALASLTFGLMHGIEFAIPLAMVGAFFGLLRDRTDGLAAPCLAHVLHNAIMVIVTIQYPEFFDYVYNR